MDNRRILLFCALMLLVHVSCASAANISLTTDRNETVVNENLSYAGIELGETIRFYIKATEVGRSAGGFTLSREVSEGFYEMIGKPHFTSSCTMCKGTREMGDLNEVYQFTPKEAGSYRAEAVYGTSVKRVDLEVYGPSTTTTSTTSTTRATSSTTSTTSTSSTSTTSSTAPTSTSTTTTLSVTSTTLPEDVLPAANGTWIPILVALVMLGSLLVISRRHAR